MMFLEHTRHIHLSSLEAANVLSQKHLPETARDVLADKQDEIGGGLYCITSDGVPPVFLPLQISSRPRIPFIKNSEHFVFSITSAVVTSAQVIRV
jgi:hypothetical protein